MSGTNVKYIRFASQMELDLDEGKYQVGDQLPIHLVRMTIETLPAVSAQSVLKFRQRATNHV